ncbi:hypothetical protein WL00_30770 [Burkholderia cepacia]|nr:hypothetical protein WL00_30770 [Burkholderia cepacia]KVX76307.1 hypothetical protein WL07_03620 [Burkholderia cepacia]
MLGRDVVFSDLFTDRRDDVLQLGKSCLFGFLCQCVSLCFEFAIGSHRCDLIPSEKIGLWL